ncbi:TPA: NEL-type E3 ubiquitin ligase domain-containing protein [Pseudomonas putida]
MTLSDDTYVEHQDWIIGRRLPQWLQGASLAQVEALQDAMSLSLYFQERAAALLKDLQGPDAFGAPLLCNALRRYLGKSAQLVHLRLRWGIREPVITSQPIGYPATKAVYRDMPLLESALRNFTAEQATQDGQLPDNRVFDERDPHALVLDAATFAQLCRQLDLGGRYQQHLAQVLQPPEAPSILARAHRYGMLADAHVARLQAVLSEEELQLVATVCAERVVPTFQGRTVQARRLQLLGCVLDRIVVLDVRDESLSPLYSSTHRVLVHIPGDPYSPWSAFPSLRHFANDLGKRLRTDSYQRFFARFVGRRQAQSFFSQMVSGYEGVSELANIALEEHLQPWGTPLFERLAAARIAQVKDDAAMIAVPVAAVDDAVQREHDRRLANEGWALLNLAGLFVPVVGAGLLAVSAWQLLGEVYHGVQAWREGDASEALDHLLNVAGDLAALAAAAAGVTVARAVWSRSALVDDMLVAKLEDGSERLWHPDLSPFRSEAPPVRAQRDEQGVWRLGAQSWIDIQGQHYPVLQRADQRWQLRPVDGHGPLLEHNGAGAWRLWWEQPLQWQDPRQLSRRLGGDWALLDDEQIDEVLRIHDLDADQLRAVHVQGQAPQASWQDSVERYLLDARIRRVIGQLRGGQRVTDLTALDQMRHLPGAIGVSDQALAELAWGQRRQLFERFYQAIQPTADASIQALRRQFPSLPVRCARQVLEGAGSLERNRLGGNGRVPLAMAESARVLVRQVRVARVLEGLYLDASQDADLARAALHLFARLPGAPTAIAWRLHEGSLSGPLLSSVGSDDAAQVFQLIHLNGTFQLAEAGQAVGERGPLFEVMAQVLDQSRAQSMGLGDPLAHNLRVRLARLASVERDEVAHGLGLREPMGWFVPPLRLAGGRLGYPLSGRGTPRRVRLLHARVRALYPSFSEAEVDNWLLATRARGVNHNHELARLQVELDNLREHLALWVQQGTGLIARAERSSVRDALMALWRRQAPRVSNPAGEPIGYRLSLWALALQELPDIPSHVSFSHVVSLSMTSMSLVEVPSGFLRAFSRLQSLLLADNELIRVPAGLGQLPELRELDLYGNRIVLDDAQAQSLAQCLQLRRLILSYNPLGRAFSVAGMSRLNVLHLRATGISETPSGLLRLHLLDEVDLRNNLITEVPEDYYRVPLWVSGSIMFGENPLTPAAAGRLRTYMRAHGWLPEAQDEPLAEIAEGYQPDEVLAYARQGWMRTVPDTDLDGFTQAWDALAAESGSQDLMLLLARLRETRDYRTDPSGLGARAYIMMCAARDNASLRQELFELASGLEGCDDAVIGRFSDLEVHMLVWRARCEAAHGAEEAGLLHLGRQLWRLDEVDRIIAEDLQARRLSGADPDEVEVGLAYRLGLRDEFDLPGQPLTMSYREVGGVDSQRLDNARARLLERETDQAVAQSMIWKDFWRTHVVRADQARFDALDRRFHAQLQVIEEMAQGKRHDAVMAGRTTQLQALQQQREALQAQARTLTEDPEALQRNQAQLSENSRALQEGGDELAALQADTVFAERMRDLTVTEDDHAQWLRDIGRERDAAWDALVLERTLAALEAARPEPQPGPSRPRSGD